MAAEKLFENKVKAYLTSKDAWFIKYWGGAKYTKTGIPDLLCCLNGHFLAVEIKAPTGRPKPLQLVNIRKIRRAGGIAIVLWPDQFEGFKVLCNGLSTTYISLNNEIYDYFDEKLIASEKEILYKN